MKDPHMHGRKPWTIILNIEIIILMHAAPPITTNRNQGS